LTRVVVSSDGKRALLRSYTGTEVVDLINATEEQIPDAGPFDPIVLCGGHVARLRQHGSDREWQVMDGVSPDLRSIPADAVPQCSADASSVAYFFAGKPNTGVTVVVGAKPQHYAIDGRIASIAFTEDNTTIFVLSRQAEGRYVLARMAPPASQITILASNLDADGGQTLAVTPDGRAVYLALASNGIPDAVARHQPDAQRWLKVYRFEVGSRTLRPIAQSANQDNFAPAIVSGSLYWLRNVLHNAVALLPAAGGDAREIAAGQLPIWSFDGKRISYIIGGWRLADWALNLDAALVGVDAQARVTSGPEVIVSGFHEDFPAAFSPNGKWIAFHSHRSSTPVDSYGALGSADDIFLRLANDPHAPEIRLTDFGWETGPAFWSPDGRKLIFGSWKKGGEPLIGHLWVITLDPDSGKVQHTDMLPLTSAIRSAQWAAWSPDGSEIAIEDSRGGEDHSLWIAKADGTNARLVLQYKASTYGGVDWTTDGKNLVYSGLADGWMQLFVVPRTGGAPKQLSHDSGNLMHPHVSPDGRWIACTRIVQSQQVWRQELPKD